MANIRGRLQLKRELTQIKKASRVLRDPGTTSSWKSPLSSSRSIAAAAVAAASGSGSSGLKNNKQLVDENTNVNVNGRGKEKKVFLYNWKNHNSSSETSAIARNDEAYRVDEDGDSLSDAKNGSGAGGIDSKSDSYFGDKRSSSMIIRCRDANLVSLATPSMRRAMEAKRKSKITNSRLDSLSRHHKKQLVLARNSVNSELRSRTAHLSIALGLGRDESVEQSDDTEDYNSEDLCKYSGASPLLLKPKHKNCSHSSSKFLRSSKKEDSSYSYSTPALSTSSYKRYVNRNPSTIGSWDTTTATLDDNDDEMDDNLDFPGRQGCGIPCYWSKRMAKHRGVCQSCCTPSLSDTLRRKGSSIFCGSMSKYHERRCSSSNSNKCRIASRSARGILPLLTNSGDGRAGSSIGTVHSDDELSTNYGELDLEALSRLDGRRWSSSCRSQDGLEIVALNGGGEEDGMLENIRSLSQKYKPMFFDELIGQNIVVQSLANAVSRGRIAPVYLFQGPRGTGKTSTAKVFAAALNCLATEETKPCGFCRECTDFISGKSRDFFEVDGTNKKGVDRVRYLLKNLPIQPPSASSQYRVFVINECHLLPCKTWLTFLKFLEEPPQQVVFIFITTDIDNVPRTIQSRCQKYLFNKIKDSDIVARLKKISAEEILDVESEALNLIALNADGSLRDAETMLDQLSLLGKRITASLVNELVGVVSDEKLLELLELAMSSDTAETVKRARELMDSGVDPMVLMSQLASLIMDIISGTYNIGGRSLTEGELERLKHALKLLSEAEKHLRVSSERSTWFTATLLQLGSVPSPELSLSCSSGKQSSKTTEEDPSSASREVTVYQRKSGVSQNIHCDSASPASVHEQLIGNHIHQGALFSQIDGHNSYFKPAHSPFKDSGALVSANDSGAVGNMIITCRNSEKLGDIWAKCIERCHSKTLKQLLRAYGKLLSISEVEGVSVAYLAFGDGDIKSRVERFLSSITNAIEIVLGRNVEVRIILLPDGEASINSESWNDLPKDLKQTQTTEAIERERKAICSNANGNYSDLDSQLMPHKLSRGSFNELEGKIKGSEDCSNCSPFRAGAFQSTGGSLKLLAEGNSELGGTKERRLEIPMHIIESIIREQRLETAWLQAAEKGTTESLSHSRPERNQVLPQEDFHQQNHIESTLSSALPSKQLENELHQELKALKLEDESVLHKDQTGKRSDHYPMSPSLLHDSNFMGNFNKESVGYESGSAAGGCSGLFCWNNGKPPKGRKVKGTPVRPRNSGRFSLFGECAKKKESESRPRR
ncbi:protein STICHEL-like [Mangifera indica]|uniref:protein STICHEL-like n=1 Tax=Mangifera indica TaxID=29780 RepID=UPI001CFB2319|nr:protein STICHEL-like [Mangifera indica]